VKRVERRTSANRYPHQQRKAHQYDTYIYICRQLEGDVAVVSTDQDPIGQLLFNIGSPVAGKDVRTQDLLKNLRLRSGW
jgi:hypothetical protein